MKHKQGRSPSQNILTAIGLTIGLTITLIGPGMAVAGPTPSSLVAWDKATRDQVKAGDPQHGKDLAAPCSGCHGKQGVSNTAYFPSLAGQLPHYLYKQLQDYKAGKRGLDSPRGAIMSVVTKPLSDQDIADIAAYYSQLPSKQTEAADTNVPSLAKKGDASRMITPCAACHGVHGEGRWVNVAALKGQRADYLAETLKAYRAGKRQNDIYSRMRLISAKLTDAEIEQLANYYAQLN